MRTSHLSIAALVVAALAFKAAAAVAACTVSVTDVVFGQYDVFGAVDTDITGGVSVSCDSDTPLQVALSAGNGTFAARKLQNGAHDLLYNLYLDPARLSIWGDGTPGTGLLGLSGLGGNYAIYGRIPARQNVPAGQYSDTIVVTLTF